MGLVAAAALINKPYYYIPIEKPSLFGSMILVLIFLFLFLFFIYYLYIINNYENYKNNPSIMTSAWLFGGNPTQIFDNWTAQSQTDILNKKIADLNGYLIKTDKHIEDVSVKIHANDSAFEIEKKIDEEIEVEVQKNISKLKDGLDKIAGTVALNSYMEKGAVSTTKKFEKSNLYKYLSGFKKKTNK